MILFSCELIIPENQTFEASSHSCSVWAGDDTPNPSTQVNLWQVEIKIYPVGGQETIYWRKLCSLS